MQQVNIERNIKSCSINLHFRCICVNIHLLAPLMYGFTMVIYVYKEFCIVGPKAKRCYSFHIALRGVNCAILSVYRTGYAHGKEPEGFPKVFLSLFNAG